MIKISRGSCALIITSFLFVSCASLQRARNDSQVMQLHHIRGNDVSCLANCVDMVLDYYGFDTYFAKQPEMNSPANLLAMDSLIQAISPPDPAHPNKLHSFVLQTDETFLREQLTRRRPVIIVITNRRHVYHSLVVAGFTADHKAFFVHDPAKSKGRWLSRAKLLKRWKTTDNTAMLIGIVPAGI